MEPDWKIGSGDVRDDPGGGTSGAMERCRRQSRAWSADGRPDPARLIAEAVDTSLLDDSFAGYEQAPKGSDLLDALARGLPGARRDRQVEIPGWSPGVDTIGISLEDRNRPWLLVEAAVTATGNPANWSVGMAKLLCASRIGSVEAVMLTIAANRSALSGLEEDGLPVGDGLFEPAATPVLGSIEVARRCEWLPERFRVASISTEPIGDPAGGWVQRVLQLEPLK